MAIREDSMGTYVEGTPVSVVDISKLPGYGKAPDDALMPGEPASRTAPKPDQEQLSSRQLPDLNKLRDRLLQNQAEGTASPSDPARQLFTDRDGNILLGDPADPAASERQSVIPQEIFYAPDLNKIAEAARENQRRGEVDPSDPSRQMFTDTDGNILMGDQVDPARAERMSKIPQETFFAANDSPRLALERRIVEDKLPRTTFQASDGSTTGWVYPVTNEFGDDYKLFVWYDAGTATYKVSVVEPDLRGKVGVEDCHLYSDGTICLKQEGGPGYRNLEDAYARSVLWTRGASCYRRGYGFQFNAGQEG
jgi:hypothetical protein